MAGSLLLKTAAPRAGASAAASQSLQRSSASAVTSAPVPCPRRPPMRASFGAVWNRASADKKTKLEGDYAMWTTLPFMLIALAVSACGSAGNTYQCRITEVTSDVSGAALDLPYIAEFAFTPTEETDIYFAGPVPSVGTNKNGDAAFVVISKLDGKFDGMQVQRPEGGTMNAGFCRKQ